jgi:4,5-dihydroxyphthalate decarboxylase
MTAADVTLALRPYDQWAPLWVGQVETPGIRLKLVHDAPLVMDFAEHIDIAEISFNRYLLAFSRGDERLVGLPAFVLRGFRHRNFFVRADSTLESLADLRGKRLGSNSWPDTGTMWARAAMRDAGVGVGDVQWVIGTLDDTTPNRPPSPHDAHPPAGAEFLSGSDTLLGLLKDGRIDAVTTAFAPPVILEKGGWLRRLVRNYRAAEADYHRRTGVYPGFHIIAARREYALGYPDRVRAVYAALERSFALWSTKVLKFGEATPWAVEELETMYRDFGADTPPFGTDSPAHRTMLATMCFEQHAQGLVERAADPDRLFAAFNALPQ